MPTLIGLAYSPWTERARWALAHHRVSHDYQEHTPLLGERALRRVARHGGFTGKATVPIWVDGDTVIVDSLLIVQHADAVGTGASLHSHRDEVRTMHALVEAALGAIRIRVTARVLENKQALREAAKAAVPAFLAGLASPVAALGARYIAKKYAFDVTDTAAQAKRAEAIEDALAAVKAMLGDKNYLLPEGFSAADILACGLLQGIRPAAAAHPLELATRAAWTDEVLAARYADLLQWRDGVYAAHRHPR
jgi:glutathione S-transferase